MSISKNGISFGTIFLPLFLVACVVCGALAYNAYDNRIMDQATLAIVAPETKALGSPDFNLQTTGGNGNGTVTFTLESGTAATVSEAGVVHIESIGEVIVSATKAASKNYNPTTSAPVTITIKTSQAIPAGVTLSAEEIVEGTVDISLSIGVSPEYQYSHNGTIWQNSSTFTNLLPSTPYTFYARLKETEFSAPSTPITITLTTMASALFILDETQTIITGLTPTGKTLESLTIPDYVTTIATESFKDNTKIRTIVIPTSVRIIQDKAFSGCTNLTTINLPDSLTYLGLDAFYRCSASKLTDIQMSSQVLELYLSIVFNKYISDKPCVLTLDFEYLNGAHASILGQYNGGTVLCIRQSPTYTLDTLNTLLHEFRHYYQAVAAFGVGDFMNRHTLATLKVKPTQDQVNAWIANFENYYTALDDPSHPNYQNSFRDYWLQPLEADARDFAAKYTFVTPDPSFI